jgi:transcriptional regulator with XRE-family HTH domain
MTPPQLRAALKRLQISQMEASRRLGVNPSTIRRWLAGSRRIPEPVAILVLLWVKARKLK